jgi:hypothetical protein
MIELTSPSNEIIEAKINNKESFLLYGVSGEIIKYCALIEKSIETNKMTCRIRTKNRTIANALLFFTVVGALGIVGQIGHKIATYDPDWEIIRDPIKNTIEVKYCRKPE